MPQKSTPFFADFGKQGTLLIFVFFAPLARLHFD
jgi:hypothetical protein